MHQENQKDYVQAVLRLYRRLPGTPARPRQADRHLAAKLHRRGVTLDVVEVALRLATARRNARPADADPLPPVRVPSWLVALASAAVAPAQQHDTIVRCAMWQYR